MGGPGDLVGAIVAGPAGLAQEGTKGLGVKLRRRGHGFVSLAGQGSDRRFWQHGRQGVGDVQGARAFGADLQQRRNREARKVFGVELVGGESAEVVERGGRVGEDGRPVDALAQCLDFRRRYAEQLRKEVPAEGVPIAGCREESAGYEMRPGGFVEDQFGDVAGKLGCGRESDMRAVGVPAEKHAGSDLVEEGDEVCGFVFDAMAARGGSLAAAAPGQGIDLVVGAEEGKKKFPVGMVIAKATVDQNEGRPLALDGERNVDAVGGFDPMHVDYAQSGFENGSLGAHGLVGGAAVDGGALAAHGAEVGGELAAMVDVVVVEELEVSRGWHVEEAVEVDGRAELFGAHGFDFGEAGLDRRFVPGGEVGAGLDRGGHGLFAHREIQRGDAVEEPNVDARDVPAEFHGGFRLGVGTIVVVGVGDGAKYFRGDGPFGGEALEQEGAESNEEFRSHSVVSVAEAGVR